MATTLFSDTTYSVQTLVDNIQRGEIALPDIQRPFVWQAAQVRDLFDSMTKGFPVGYLLFWKTGAEATAKQIGIDVKDQVPRLLIVDGQQRLTSLFAVMTGQTIVRADYTEGRIKIAYRPSDGTFAVTDAAIERDAEFIPDISALWTTTEGSIGGTSNFKKVEKAFFKRLAEKRTLDEDEVDRLSDALDKVRDLSNYPFKAVELDATIGEEEVAEVFVRINSKGVSLNQADFILTLMSVFWEQGRRDLEAFARDCKTPTKTKASPFNWYIEPSPAQLLRVSVGLAFKRAVLSSAYSLLRGKDLDSGKVDPARREVQFAILQKAHDQVLNLTNWHEFLNCLERAGYRGSKMISSDNTLLFSYALFLIGRVECKVPLDKLQDVIARWFFMAHMTGRYSGAFESQFEQDVAPLKDLGSGDSQGFLGTLGKIINDTLTSDYWTIGLPNELATSAAKSPALLAYIASLNILDADALLSTDKVRSRLDPVLTTEKGIERHHLFPKAYLKSQLGISDVKQVNQIANMALVVWWDNITISDDAPTKYWPEQLAKKQLKSEILARQLHLHALPENWTSLSYSEFLEVRRRLMADVVREAFEHLSRTDYTASYPAPGTYVPAQVAERRPANTTLLDLLEGGMLSAGAQLFGRTGGRDVYAQVHEDGSIDFEGQIFSTPSGAAAAARQRPTNGWEFWRVASDDDTPRLSALRREMFGEIHAVDDEDL